MHLSGRDCGSSTGNLKRWSPSKMALPDRIVHREAGQAAGVAETSCSKTGLDSDRRLLSGSDLQSGERITGSAVGGERVGQ